MPRRPIVTATAAVLAVGILASGCSQAVDTSEVSSGGPTTTAAASRDDDRTSSIGPGVVTDGPTPTAPPAARPAGTTATPQAQAALDLLTRIARDPAAFARANGLTQEQLARQLGVSPEVLRQLQVNPEGVAALGNLLNRIDRSTVDQLASGRVNPQLLATVVSLLGAVNPQAVAGLENIDPRALSVLASAASSVDPKIIEAVGNVVSVADPSGLGSLAGDRNSLAILSLLFGVALRTDPTQFRQLSALNNLTPGFQFVIDGISSVVAAFDPRTVAFLNEVNDNFSPELIAALSGITSALSRPEVQTVLAEATKDPDLIATIVGVAALLVPGLAQVIAPDVFAANPNAQNVALVALLLTALGRANGIDLTALAG